MSHIQPESPWRENAKFYADLINRVGFPIVVSIFLAWLVLFKMEEQKTIMVGTMTKIGDTLDKLGDKIEALHR